jgi:hypothetical protein
MGSLLASMRQRAKVRKSSAIQRGEGGGESWCRRSPASFVDWLIAVIQSPSGVAIQLLTSNPARRR